MALGLLNSRYKGLVISFVNTEDVSQALLYCYCTPVLATVEH